MCVYLDHVLITGRTHDDHLRNLTKVLHRMSAAGMRLHRNKCYFMLPQVQYLGHTVSCRGIQATAEKVTATKEAPVPPRRPSTQVVPRTHQLLCQVFAQPVYNTCPTVFTAQQEGPLALGPCATVIIQ